MAVGIFATGRYAGTYTRPAWRGGGAVPLGITESGFFLGHQMLLRPISPTDAFGDTEVDYIYRGWSVTLQFTLIEYTPAWLALAFSHMTAITNAGVYTMIHGLAGLLASDSAGSLVLTVTAGTPASVTGPLTITFYRAHMAPGANVMLQYSSELRKMPMSMVVLPNENISPIVYYAAA